MGVLPAHNARLTAVSRKGEGGPVDDYDTTEAVEDQAVWSGDTDAFIRVKNIKSTASGQLDYFKETTITIPAEVEITSGDVLTLTHEGEEASYIVRDFERLPAIDPFPLTRVVVERA